jgi:hypothetical protein
MEGKEWCLVTEHVGSEWRVRMRGAIGIMRIVAEVRKSEASSSREKYRKREETMNECESMMTSSMDLSKRTSQGIWSLFSEANEHTTEEVKGENGTKTTEQPRPSPLRSEKQTTTRGPKIRSSGCPDPRDGHGGRIRFSSAVYAEDGIGIGPEVDTPLITEYMGKSSGCSKEKTHLSTTCRAIIAARLEPPVHAILMEHMSTREQP